jgi:N utilization substance protein B
MSRRPPPPDRHLARALAMQGLYQWRISGADEASIEAHLPEFADYQHEGREENESGARRKADMTLCTTLLRGVIREHETLVEALSPVLDRPFAELSPVEAAILLMSTWELANCPEIPYRVVLNEAIELAKQFGSNEGHRYVNGVLDKVAGRLRGQEARAKKEKA